MARWKKAQIQCVQLAMDLRLSRIQPSKSMEICRKVLCVLFHYSDVVMSAMALQISDVSIACSTVGSGAERKHQSSVSLAFVWGTHRWPVDSPHKGPVTRKMLPFDDLIMRHVYVKLSSAVPLYKRAPIVVFTVPSDALASITIKLWCDYSVRP